MPPPVDPKIIQEERDALKKVVVKKFGATPKSVPTFGTTTVSWDVTIPSTADISLVLDGGPVPAAGSKSFPLIQNHTFRLAARTEHAGRALRSVAVTVDLSSCQTKLLQSLLVTGSIEGSLIEAFGGSSKLKFKDDSPEAVLSDGTISVGLRTVINVPDWFDADMNITIQLAVVSGGGLIKVSSKGLFVNVKWGFFEHLASVFCTGFVQSGMEQIAKELLAHIVDAELVPGIATALDKERADFVKELQDKDPQHREFVMTLVKVAANGISITACPK